MAGVIGIVNDMIIHAKDEQEPDMNLLNFMDTCMRKILTDNAEKIQFKQSLCFPGLLLVQEWNFTWSKEDWGYNLYENAWRSGNNEEFPWDGELYEQILSALPHCVHYLANSPIVTDTMNTKCNG